MKPLRIPMPYTEGHLYAVACDERIYVFPQLTEGYSDTYTSLWGPEGTLDNIVDPIPLKIGHITRHGAYRFFGKKRRRITEDEADEFTSYRKQLITNELFECKLTRAQIDEDPYEYEMSYNWIRENTRPIFIKVF